MTANGRLTLIASALAGTVFGLLWAARDVI